MRQSVCPGGRRVPVTGTPPLFSLARLILHFESRALLWPTLPTIIETRRRNVGMSQPLLYLRNVSIVRQGISRSCQLFAP